MPEVTLEPMDARFDPAAIEDLHARLARTRWMPSGDEGWSRGVPTSWLADLLADWAAFDVAGLERRLAGLTHLRAGIEGQAVHVAVAAGSGPAPLPLLLANGWPSSFCEYLDVLPLLTDPGGHGGDPADSFTVVMPALPGFGFSGPPPGGGAGAAQVAGWWDQLMTDGLGHRRYVAHGSDLGAGVIAQLARRPGASVAAIHLATPSLLAPPEPRSPAVARYAGEVDAWSAEEGGYAHLQATKPATVGAALLDSPAGLAAWIGEKFTAWSSLDASGQPAFARELVLATLTVYWTTGTIASSMLPYWKYRHTSGSALPLDDPSPVPTGISIFGGERIPFPKPPRELAARFYNLQQWEEHDRGGHFPAAAEPELLARTLREAFRPYRDGAGG